MCSEYYWDVISYFWEYVSGFGYRRARPTDERTMTLFAVILIAVGIVSFLVSALALASCLKGKGHFRKRKKRTASDDTVEIRLDEQWKQPAPGKTTERPAEEVRKNGEESGDG